MVLDPAHSLALDRYLKFPALLLLENKMGDRLYGPNQAQRCAVLISPDKEKVIELNCIRFLTYTRSLA